MYPRTFITVILSSLKTRRPSSFAQWDVDAAKNNN